MTPIGGGVDLGSGSAEGFLNGSFGSGAANQADQSRFDRLLNKLGSGTLSATDGFVGFCTRNGHSVGPAMTYVGGKLGKAGQAKWKAYTNSLEAYRMSYEEWQKQELIRQANGQGGQVNPPRQPQKPKMWTPTIRGKPTPVVVRGWQGLGWLGLILTGYSAYEEGNRVAKATGDKLEGAVAGTLYGGSVALGAYAGAKAGFALGTAFAWVPVIGVALPFIVGSIGAALGGIAGHYAYNHGTRHLARPITEGIYRSFKV
ncbi:MAG: hypothetical protein NZO16_00210 [Deltaproteobacteria bacterium]|nr:hypothetical protein [Deltaproteobacteria bacterium]